MKTRFLLLVAAGVAFAATTARADSGEGWIKMTTDKGCYLYKYGMTTDGMDREPYIEGFIWTGPCSPGQPISGDGTLYMQFRNPNGAIYSLTGRIVNGLPDGPMRMLRYEVSADGRWDPAAGYVEAPDLELQIHQQGCPQWTIGWDCEPGRVENPIVVPPVSPPYFPLPGQQQATPQSTQIFSIGGSSAQPASAGPSNSFLGGKRVDTPLKSGTTLQGSSNLDCVVFVPGEGPDARSSLVNQCGEEVRLNYCLRYLNGNDNCSPMSVGHEATVWPVRPGAWLTMPAADTLKLWSVFACRSPTFPLWATFKNGMLTDGICPEDNLAPPRPQSGEAVRIVRSNDSKTWPPGWANKQCLKYNPQLDRSLTAYVQNNCDSDLIIYVCVVPNGSGGPILPCLDRPLIPAHMLIPISPSGSQIIAKPNTYHSVHVFACDAPLVPDEIRWDGRELTGRCKTP